MAGTMDLRTCVSFECDFPMGVDRTLPPGKELAEFVVDSLVAAGLEAEGPDNYEGWAWDFACNVDRVSVYCVLGAVDDRLRQWAIRIEAQAPLLDRLRGRRSTDRHRRFCEALDKVIKSDPRFCSIRWYTADAWDCGRDNDWGDTP